MPLLYPQKFLCLPQLPEFNVTSQPVPPRTGPCTLGGQWLGPIRPCGPSTGARLAAKWGVGGVGLSGHPGSTLPPLLGPGTGAGQACVSTGLAPGSVCPHPSPPPHEDRSSQHTTVPFLLLSIKLSFH